MGLFGVGLSGEGGRVPLQLQGTVSVEDSGVLLRAAAVEEHLLDVWELCSEVPRAGYVHSGHVQVARHPFAVVVEEV